MEEFPVTTGWVIQMAYSIKKISDCWNDYLYGSYYYTDPVMGPGATNCSFIAALSAVAWTATTRLYIAYSKTENNLKYCKVRFSTPAGGNDDYETSEELCLDCTLGNPFKCAYSSKWPGVKEVWPGLYEKAYAARYLNRSCCGCDQDVCPANPDPPLNRLCGCAATTVALTIDSILALCAGIDPARKTKYPMVIWTRTSADFIRENLLNRDQMKPDHAYTVLGTYKYNNTYYLVLRNPESKIIAGHNNSNALVAGQWTQINNLYNCKTGVVSTVKPSTTVNFGDKGIFALLGSKIPTYFLGCSYAKG
jgi:hypothetical protein